MCDRKRNCHYVLKCRFKLLFTVDYMNERERCTVYAFFYASLYLCYTILSKIRCPYSNYISGLSSSCYVCYFLYSRAMLFFFHSLACLLSRTCILHVCLLHTFRILFVVDMLFGSVFFPCS